MKPNSIVTAHDPRFDELTSGRQRSALNELLCTKLCAPPGTEIICKTIAIERRGGVYWADLRTEWEGATLAFHVKWLNRSGAMRFFEGWRLTEKEMHLYRAA